MNDPVKQDKLAKDEDIVGVALDLDLHELKPFLFLIKSNVNGLNSPGNGDEVAVDDKEVDLLLVAEFERNNGEGDDSEGDELRCTFC